MIFSPPEAKVAKSQWVFSFSSHLQAKKIHETSDHQVFNLFVCYLVRIRCEPWGCTLFPLPDGSYLQSSLKLLTPNTLLRQTCFTYPILNMGDFSALYGPLGCIDSTQKVKGNSLHAG